MLNGIETQISIANSAIVARNSPSAPFRTSIPETESSSLEIDAGGNTSSPASTTQSLEASESSQTGQNQSDTLSPETLEALLAAQEETNVLSGELTQEQQSEVRELEQRDQEVRAHEQAHKNVGGAYTGPISYTTVTGPDGQQYAVGGEVQIDSSPIPNNPEATIRKLEVVERAALAPAEPSPQDVQVARQAQAGQLQARRELREQDLAERQDTQSANVIEQRLEEATAVDDTDSSSFLEFAAPLSGNESIEASPENPVISTAQRSQDDVVSILFGS